MAASVVLARIAAWEQAGLIDHPLAERLRAAEGAAAGAPGSPAGAPGSPVPPGTLATVGSTPVPEAAPRLALDAAAPAVARLRSSGFILEFFAYLGGLFVLLAWYAWFLNELPESEVERMRGVALATLAPAILLGLVGGVLAGRRDERLRRAATIALVVAVPNVGVAAWALLRATVVGSADDAVAVAIGAGLALVAALAARIRRPAALTQAVLLAAWGVFALDLASWVEATLWEQGYDPDYGDVMRRSGDEQVLWNGVRLAWWWLVAAVPAVVMLRRPDRAPGHETRDAVSRVGIGVIAVAGSATAALATYDWWSPRGGEPIFGPWIAAAIMVAVGAVFVGAARVSGSRIHLVTAGVAILVGLTYLNVELVVEAVGAPAALLVEGAILLGIAVLGWVAGRLLTRRAGGARDPA